MTKTTQAAVDRVDAITLRLATVASALRAASTICIQHAKADDELQSASDIIDLAEQDIMRLRSELAEEVSHD
jgi:hypothetical protein